ADLRPVVADEGDRYGEVGNAASEIRRTVDGVDDPDIPPEGAAAFLAEKGVAGAQFLQAAADQLLHFCIGRRQKVLMSFEIGELRAWPFPKPPARQHASL